MTLLKSTFSASLVLLLTSASLLAQQASERGSFVLPKGVATYSYQLVAELPVGSEATLAGLQVTDAEGSAPILSLAFAKTFLAARAPKLFIEFTATRTDTSEAQRFEVQANYQVRQARLQARSGPTEPTTSVLASGEFVKLEVDDHGIYQLDQALLNSLGFSESTPQSVRLYSKGGAMLPTRVGMPYPTDLQEIALLEVGNGNAAWDEGEKLVFYGEGEDVWRFDESLADFTRTENLYSERTYYYLTVGGEGKRLQAAAPVSATTYEQTYTAVARWEQDLENLLYYRQQKFGSGQGSGQQWFGPLLGTNRSYTIPEPVSLGTIVPGGSGKLRARLAASSLRANTRFTVDLDGAQYTSSSIRTGSQRSVNNNFANYGQVTSDIALSNGSVNVTFDYPGSLDANPGWIDYVELTHDAVLAYAGAPLFFQSNQHTAPSTFGFSILTTSNLAVLDITNAVDVSQMASQDIGGRVQFGYSNAADTLPHRFVAFDPTQSFAAPVSAGEVVNSNLHAVSRADMIIVYGNGLEEQAERLADHRRSHSGFIVQTASMDAVAHEFGGGRYDPTAIRTFARMLHERDTQFRYLLLLGDAHFDPRNIAREEPNMIPVFQTDDSFNEIYGYPTDDYFGLLDDGEGIEEASIHPRGALDIGIGRIPVNQAREAAAVIDKIIRYDSDIELQGAWRLRNVFVADDEDNNGHSIDMDRVAVNDAQRFEDFNQVKIYVDAYEQVPTPGGVRIPRAAEAINQNMFRGNLVTTYLGHGGPRGWGQERFLNAPDIDRWNAEKALPVLVTATCTFTGFDDPEVIVAGEQVLLKPNGGSVATVSTVRPVFTNGNYRLTLATHNQILADSLANSLGLGALLMRAKNFTGDGENNRKFTLFGDPAMQLAVPELDVEVLRFDSIDVRTSPDTVSVPPLQEVVVSGVVNNPDGALAADFNGEIVLSVFDQALRARTLGQDPESRVQEFDQQTSLLFSGRASVTGGQWTARFMLPRDVSLSRGLGRLSMYASSPDGRDGSGLFKRFQIDGLAPPGINDDTPPLVEVFLGSEEFVAGGITSEDPVIVAKLSDNTGINVSGATIGHDLSATLRGGSEGTYVLNDFYQAAKDDYRQGVARYPLFDLPQGEYELEVRAWDLANNTGTGITNFVVSDDASVALRQVLNYPNPFVDATCFQFEHTAAGQFVEVQVDIYTTSGRLVRSLRHEGVAQGFRFGNEDCLQWDGTDTYGQRLARGVYLYKVHLRADDDSRSGESEFERLVVLR